MGMDVNPGLAGGLLLGALLGSRQARANMPAQVAPSPAPQPAHAPDAQQILADMQAPAGTAGVSSTFLTGPQGVDPKTVKTVKQSLYGN